MNDPYADRTHDDAGEPLCTATPLENPQPTKLTFLKVFRLLWDWRGWYHENGLYTISTHKNTGLYFFTAHFCVRLRQRTGEIVYEPFIHTWFLLIAICLRMEWKLYRNSKKPTSTDLPPDQPETT